MAVPLLQAGPITYAYQTVVFPGDTFTQLLGINNSSVIAGYHNVTANQGFTLNLPATFTGENFPSAASTQVVGINNTGLTAGFYVDGAGVTHGFTFNGSSSSFTTQDAPGTAFNQLMGINDGLTAAGYSSTDPTGATLQRSYIVTGGIFTYLDGFLPAGAGNNQATDVNDSGVVSGFFLTGSNSTGYLLSGGTLTQLQFPGSTFTQALGLNNFGDVVGSYTSASGTHGFLYNGTYESIDDPSGVGTTVVNGINDEGQIVGFYTDANGNTDGFVATPTLTPEPSSLLLLGIGALGFFGPIRRKLFRRN